MFLRFGLLAAAGLCLVLVLAEDEEVIKCDGGECVKLHLCNNGELNTDGANIIDIRFNPDNECEDYLLKCCRVPPEDEFEAIVEPPSSGPIEQPVPTPTPGHSVEPVPVTVPTPTTAGAHGTGPADGTGKGTGSKHPPGPSTSGHGGYGGGGGGGGGNKDQGCQGGGGCQRPSGQQGANDEQTEMVEGAIITGPKPSAENHVVDANLPQTHGLGPQVPGSVTGVKGTPAAGPTATGNQKPGGDIPPTGLNGFPTGQTPTTGRPSGGQATNVPVAGGPGSGGPPGGSAQQGGTGSGAPSAGGANNQAGGAAGQPNPNAGGSGRPQSSGPAGGAGQPGGNGLAAPSAGGANNQPGGAAGQPNPNAAQQGGSGRPQSSGPSGGAGQPGGTGLAAPSAGGANNQPGGAAGQPNPNAAQQGGSGRPQSSGPSGGVGQPGGTGSTAPSAGGANNQPGGSAAQPGGASAPSGGNKLPNVDNTKHTPPKGSNKPVPSHTTASPINVPAKCGIRNVDGVGFRITGDNDGESEYGEFPWMVAILKEEKALDQVINVYQCGGSLIHPSVVLTAAHCVQNRQAPEMKVRLGEWDTQTKNEIYDYQDRNVVEIVTHAEFYKGGLFNDVALLFLDKPAELMDTVSTICLPPADYNFDLSRCFASGWGKDVFGKQGTYQVILKKIELPIMQRDTCQKALRTTRLGARFKLHKSFICAGGEKGRDTCKGDGGSPLVCPIPGTVNQYYQAGMVAWGIGCGEDGIPGVYVNVPLFRGWIDDHLKQRNIPHNYYLHA